MDTLFALIFMISTFLFPFVLLKPSVLTKIFRKKFTRKQAFAVMSAIIFSSFVLTGIFAESVEDLAQKDSELAEEPALVIKDEEVLSSRTALVARVIDGDTLELADGTKVRYIGIDTPETTDPKREKQCYGAQASAKNKELVEGKEVRLEKDVSETDRYGRLLRYVYIDDIFINEYLVEHGYAIASSYPPDVKYQDDFRRAEQTARSNKRGLWGECSNTKESEISDTHSTQNSAQVKTFSGTNITDVDDSAPTEPQPPQTQSRELVVPAVEKTNSSAGNSTTYSCNCSKTCPNISSCEEAQYLLNICGCSKRDGDKDGIACDAAPLHCQH